MRFELTRSIQRNIIPVANASSDVEVVLHSNELSKLAQESLAVLG